MRYLIIIETEDVTHKGLEELTRSLEENRSVRQYALRSMAERLPRFLRDLSRIATTMFKTYHRGS